MTGQICSWTLRLWTSQCGQPNRQRIFPAFLAGQSSAILQGEVVCSLSGRCFWRRVSSVYDANVGLNQPGSYIFAVGYIVLLSPQECSMHCCLNSGFQMSGCQALSRDLARNIDEPSLI